MIEHSTSSEALDAEDEWAGYINQRLNHVTAVLADIGNTIETVEPHHREHAADLLDAAIDPVERLRRRFGPHQPDDDPENPPF